MIRAVIFVTIALVAVADNSCQISIATCNGGSAYDAYVGAGATSASTHQECLDLAQTVANGCLGTIGKTTDITLMERDAVVYAWEGDEADAATGMDKTGTLCAGGADEGKKLFYSLESGGKCVPEGCWVMYGSESCSTATTYNDYSQGWFHLHGVDAAHLIDTCDDSADQCQNCAEHKAWNDCGHIKGNNGEFPMVGRFFGDDGKTSKGRGKPFTVAPLEDEIKEDPVDADVKVLIRSHGFVGGKASNPDKVTNGVIDSGIDPAAFVETLDDDVFDFVVNADGIDVRAFDPTSTTDQAKQEFGILKMHPGRAYFLNQQQKNADDVATPQVAPLVVCPQFLARCPNSDADCETCTVDSDCLMHCENADSTVMNDINLLECEIADITAPGDATCTQARAVIPQKGDISVRHYCGHTIMDFTQYSAAVTSGHHNCGFVLKPRPAGLQVTDASDPTSGVKITSVQLPTLEYFDATKPGSTHGKILVSDDRHPQYEWCGELPKGTGMHGPFACRGVLGVDVTTNVRFGAEFSNPAGSDFCQHKMTIKEDKCYPCGDELGRPCGGDPCKDGLCEPFPCATTSYRFPGNRVTYVKQDTSNGAAVPYGFCRLCGYVGGPECADQEALIGGPDNRKPCGTITNDDGEEVQLQTVSEGRTGYCYNPQDCGSDGLPACDPSNFVDADFLPPYTGGTFCLDGHIYNSVTGLCNLVCGTRSLSRRYTSAVDPTQTEIAARNELRGVAQVCTVCGIAGETACWDGCEVGYHPESGVSWPNALCVANNAALASGRGYENTFYNLVDDVSTLYITSAQDFNVCQFTNVCNADETECTSTVSSTLKHGDQLTYRVGFGAAVTCQGAVGVHGGKEREWANTINEGRSFMGYAALSNRDQISVRMSEDTDAAWESLTLEISMHDEQTWTAFDEFKDHCVANHDGHFCSYVWDPNTKEHPNGAAAGFTYRITSGVSMLVQAIEERVLEYRNGNDRGFGRASIPLYPLSSSDLYGTPSTQLAVASDVAGAPITHTCNGDGDIFAAHADANGDVSLTHEIRVIGPDGVTDDAASNFNAPAYGEIFEFAETNYEGQSCKLGSNGDHLAVQQLYANPTSNDGTSFLPASTFGHMCTPSVTVDYVHILATTSGVQCRHTSQSDTTQPLIHEIAETDTAGASGIYTFHWKNGLTSDSHSFGAYDDKIAANEQAEIEDRTGNADVWWCTGPVKMTAGAPSEHGPDEFNVPCVYMDA